MSHWRINQRVVCVAIGGGNGWVMTTDATTGWWIFKETTQHQEHVEGPEHGDVVTIRDISGNGGLSFYEWPAKHYYADHNFRPADTLEEQIARIEDEVQTQPAPRP